MGFTLAPAPDTPGSTDRQLGDGNTSPKAGLDVTARFRTPIAILSAVAKPVPNRLKGNRQGQI